MSQAKTINTIEIGRRAFLSASAGAAAAVAAVAVPKALASPLDDSALVKLEEQIFEQYEGACAFDAEILRLSEIWTAEGRRRYDEALSKEAQAGKYLTPEQRWDLVTEMAESKEHDRLCRLRDIHLVKMEALVKQMWAIPALTPEGRRAKVLVALRLLPDHWREVDEKTDYGVLEARQLLIEFVGGEPGASLRDQFA